MRVKLTCKSVALDTANKVQDIIRLLTLRSVEEGDGEDVARLQPSSVRDADARPPAALRQPQPQEVRDGQQKVSESIPWL
jgi:hypothetical protein